MGVNRGAPAGLRVAVLGATGLAGSGVLRACLDELRVREIRAFADR